MVQSLCGQLLLASPALTDSNFRRAVVLIGVLEMLQLWMPGRHARLEDFVVDALAACVGLAMAAALDWMIKRTRRPSIGTS